MRALLARLLPHCLCPTVGMLMESQELPDRELYWRARLYQGRAACRVHCQEGLRRAQQVPWSLHNYPGSL